MLEIPGIDAQKVELYGRFFLTLIHNAQHSYESMMQQQEDRIQDPNHVNVINISDDDDTGNYDLDDFDDGSPRERSTYFPSRRVEAFNAESKSVHASSFDPTTDRGFSVTDTASTTEDPHAVPKPRC